jgi:uncharacterized protein involved in exopolysaccharide biosynthesis
MLSMRQQGGTAISTREILIFVFKWKWTIMSTLIGAVMLVTVLVYLLPPTYTALSSVLVEHTQGPSMRAEVHAGSEMIEVINTESQIISSRSVMQAVVDTLKLPELPEQDTTLSRLIGHVSDYLISIGLIDAVSKREKWIAGLLHDVKVKPVVNSNIIMIKYAHEDPQLATDIVNAITNQYLANHLRIYSQAAVAEFYQAQMDEAKTEMDRLREGLETYKASASLGAASAKKDRLVTEMGNLRERVGTLNLELTEVLTKYETDHPKVGLVRSKITDTENRISGVRKQIEVLERANGRTVDMEMMIKTQEETYRSYREQYRRASQNAIDNRNIVNVRVVDYAAVPAKPSFSRLFLIFIAIAGGTLLSVVIAMIREYFDHRVTTPEVVEQVLGVPVFGSIKKFRPRSLSA